MEKDHGSTHYSRLKARASDLTINLAARDRFIPCEVNFERKVSYQNATRYRSTGVVLLSSSLIELLPGFKSTLTFQKR